MTIQFLDQGQIQVQGEYSDSGIRFWFSVRVQFQCTKRVQVQIQFEKSGSGSV